MSNEIRECDDHRYFVGQECETCGIAGEQVMAGNRRRELSKFMSWALRHDPGSAGITVDENGWADAYAVVEAAQERHGWVTAEMTAAIVSTDEKGRFEVDGNRIRAVYGHSIDVTINRDDGNVPNTLYHGTPKQNVDAIMEEGLQPMSREEVHLTDSIEEARAVGTRHSDSVVILSVDAASLQEFTTIDKRGDHIYTTPEVPPKYVKVHNG